MDYEIVNLEEKIVTTLHPVCLSNLDADMPEKIGNYWQNFSEKYSEVKNKINNKPISIYSNYESNEKGKYDIERL